MITAKYKKKLDSFNGIKEADIPLVSENEELKNDISKLLSILKNKTNNKNQKFGMRWITGLERYIYSINGCLNKPFKEKLRRGNIIEIELFGHFDKELTFLHPAIVLAELSGNQILVAPITSKFHKQNEKYLLEIGADEGLKQTSYIKLNEIITINKHRILYKHSDYNNQIIRLSDDVLNNIDEKILTYYSPSCYTKTKEISKENERLQNEIYLLKQQLDEFQTVN